MDSIIEVTGIATAPLCSNCISSQVVDTFIKHHRSHHMYTLNEILKKYQIIFTVAGCYVWMCRFVTVHTYIQPPPQKKKLFWQSTVKKQNMTSSISLQVRIWETCQVQLFCIFQTNSYKYITKHSSHLNCEAPISNTFSNWKRMCHMSKRTDSLGKQQLELSTHM